MLTTTTTATKTCVSATRSGSDTSMVLNNPWPRVAMMLASSAATAPAMAAPIMSSRSAAQASTGRIRNDGGASVQKAAMVSNDVAASTPNASSLRASTISRCLDHSRIGEATTNTPSASPAHQLTTVLNQGVRAWFELTVPPISAPKNGPAAHAPAMNAAKSDLLRRSGLPAHQASVSEAPTIGSTMLAAANPIDTHGGLPK